MSININLCHECTKVCSTVLSDTSICEYCETPRCLDHGRLILSPTDIDVLGSNLKKMLCENAFCDNCMIILETGVDVPITGTCSSVEESFTATLIPSEASELSLTHHTKIDIDEIVHQDYTKFSFEIHNGDGVMLRSCYAGNDQQNATNCRGGSRCKHLRFFDRETYTEKYVCDSFLERHCSIK